MGMIEFSGVNKDFVLPNETIHVLKDVNFSIPEESFTIMYGPSGSGKSTLLNVMVGLEEPSTGRISLAGQDLYSMNTDQRANHRARLVGMVYQSNYWIGSLNVQENVAMPLFLSGASRQEAVKEALVSLEKVGMQEYAKSQPVVLSGGQQQRVSIARALAGDPTLIVADEPTGNLDTKNGDMIMSMLYELRHVMGKTVVMVTHNLGYLPLSDHRLQIKDGMVLVEAGEYGLGQADKSKLLKDFQSNIETQDPSGERKIDKSTEKASKKNKVDGLGLEGR
jgi:putative ABC transport system ATP-binding protein